MTLIQRSLCAAAAAVLIAAPILVHAQAADAAKTEPVYLEEPPSLPPATVARQFTATEKYDDGTKRVERGVLQMSDDEIINHGTFTEYYRNGQKFAEGNYANGVYDGEWTFWYEDGRVAKKVNFTSGRPDGSWEAYRADGTLSAKRGYKDGERDGEWISYYDDGKTPKIEQNFANGALEGDRVTYYPSGVKHQIAQFKAGVLNGKVTEWNEAGAKTAEAEFADGKINGEVVKWEGGDATEQSIRKMEEIDNENAERKLGPIDKPLDETQIRTINR